MYNRPGLLTMNDPLASEKTLTVTNIVLRSVTYEQCLSKSFDVCMAHTALYVSVHEFSLCL